MQNAIITWKEVVQGQDWKTPHNVKETYPKASPVGNCDWWFDLNPGAYRLLAKINFIMGIVHVVKICTHKEYMKISKRRK